MFLSKLIITISINKLLKIQKTISQIFLMSNKTNKLKLLEQTKTNSLNSTKKRFKPCKQIIIFSRTQTINKLNKKNDEQRQQFKVLNQKLNKAFAKLSASKIKQPEKQSTQPQNTQLDKVKKQLQNEMKKNKIIKKQLQFMKQTQNMLNSQDKFNQLKNQIVQKNKEIKELKQKLKVYEKAEQNQKKMTHFRKQQELNKKLHQINQENIFLKKKINQLKAKIQQMEKQKIMQKAEQAVQKNLTKNQSPKKPANQMIKKQVYEQQIKKFQNQIKVYQNIKSTMQKTHKQQTQSLRKQNIQLSEEIQQLKHEIKRKNKEKLLIQSMKRSTHIRSQLKTSRLQRNSMTIQMQNDKNYHKDKLRTISPLAKSQNQLFGSIRKQFIGLSYGNFSNDYKKQDDSLILDQTRSYTIVSLTFTYFQQHILSLKVKYKYFDGSQKTLTTFDLQSSYSNIKKSELILQQHQYIKQMDIYGRKMIQLIQIRTSRNQFFQVGNQKNQVKCKKFTFNIKGYQKPIAFGCITQYKKINDIKTQCLVVLGLILKKKDVLISKKKNQQSNKKTVQKNRYQNESIEKNKISANLQQKIKHQKKK